MSILFEPVVPPDEDPQTSDVMQDPGVLRKKQLLKYMEHILGGYEKNKATLKNLKAAAETGDMGYMYENCPVLAKKLAGMATEISMIPAEYGIKDKNGYISRMAVAPKNIQVTQTKEELHIILPELLPHRPQFDSTTGRMRYLYDVDKWRSEYYNAFSAEFLYGKYRIMDVKACMIFLNHVKGADSSDVDNFEYKVITDLITLFVLVDDSHRCLSQYMDVVEDEENYTEIIVCPLKRMGDYLDIG